MKKLVVFLAAATLTACGGSGAGSAFLPGETGACSNDGQKQTVLDELYTWYLWNDLLPANIDIANYASPEALVIQVTEEFGPQDANGGPLDRFSSVGSAAADAQFFGEGQYEGFGFSWRLLGNEDLRIVRVHSDSPANVGGLGRGQLILRINGRTVADITANEGVSAALTGSSIEFQMQRVDSSIFTVSITEGLVTIDPIPQWRIIDAGNGRNVGYIEFAQFISTANPVFETVFAAFKAANVNDVIIDMRYNGGGLVSTAERLADYLGGDVAENLVFTDTRFNADRAADNDRTAFFGRLGNSISLSRLVVIATSGTASASEAIANGLEPHVDVTIVGSDTRGKPVGQVGFEFCEKVIRPTSFQLFNANGFGDYFDGLPVDCAAADDLNADVGDDTDPNLVSALSYLENNACPVVLAPGGISKPQSLDTVPEIERRDSPTREYLDAF